MKQRLDTVATSTEYGTSWRDVKSTRAKWIFGMLLCSPTQSQPNSTDKTDYTTSQIIYTLQTYFGVWVDVQTIAWDTFDGRNTLELTAVQLWTKKFGLGCGRTKSRNPYSVTWWQYVSIGGSRGRTRRAWRPKSPDSVSLTYKLYQM